MLHAKGPLLTVDVSEKTATEKNIDGLLEELVGGRAVATALAHDRIPFDAKPFGPENRVYLSTGPLQQSNMSFTGRMSLTGLSPLTDGLLSTNAGGYLSRNFTATGISLLEFVGESDELLAIHVTDDGVEFEEVPELEEATVKETSQYMEENHDLGPDNCVAIGPAGENLVRFASVMTFNSRAFGRGGLGAILGSKNVKCVTFDGDSPQPVEIPNPPEMDVHREAATSDDAMRETGTTGHTQFIHDNFSLPTRYFKDQKFEHVEGIGGAAIAEKKYKKGACSACAYACKLPTRDEETGFETEGPEFETVYAFGSQHSVGDIVEVMKANELCDELGMDTISAGVTVAAYLESEDEFGNAELAQELTEKIAYRDGIGDLLAEGVHRIHDELGVEDWTVKGMEFAAHDGRAIHGQGLSYAVANRGGDHMYESKVLTKTYGGEIAAEGTKDKIDLLIEGENDAGFRDSGIVCAFGRDYVTPDVLEQLFDATYDELLEIGSKTVERERHFNNQRGMDADEDTLPYDLPDLEESISEYYAVRGWNPDGTIPSTNVERVAPADD